MFCHVTGCYGAYNPGLTDAMICSMPSNRSFVSSYLCYKHFFFTFHFCSSSDDFFFIASVFKCRDAISQRGGVCHSMGFSVT